MSFLDEPMEHTEWYLRYCEILREREHLIPPLISLKYQAKEMEEAAFTADHVELAEQLKREYRHAKAVEDWLDRFEPKETIQ